MPIAFLFAPVLSLSALTLPPADELLGAVPEDALLVVHVTDPRGLVTLRETSDWAGFVTDPAWVRAIAPILAETGEASPEEVTAWRSRMLGAMGDAAEAVFFMAADLDGGEMPPSALLVRGGAEVGRELRGFLGDDAIESELGAHTALQSDAGRIELYVEHQGVHLVVDADSQDEARAMATECLARLASTDRTGPTLGLAGIDVVRESGQLEVFFDLGPIWNQIAEEGGSGEMPPAVFDAFASMRWMYLSAKLGEGEQMDWSFAMPYDEKGYAGKFMSFFGAADTSLLRRVPAGAMSATIYGLDVSGLVDWIFEEIEKEAPEVHDQAHAALGGLTESFGIDVLGDLVGNLTGQILVFQSQPDIGEAAGFEEQLMQLQSATMAFAIADPEPFIDAIEVLLDVSGVGAMVETEEVHGADLWRMDPGLGFEVALSAGPGFATFSYDPDSLVDFLGMPGDGTRSIMGDERMTAALKGLSGSAVSIQSTPATFELIGTMISSMADLGTQLGTVGEDFGATFEAFRTLGGTASELSTRYFEGTLASTMQVGGGYLRMNVQAR